MAGMAATEKGGERDSCAEAVRLDLRRQRVLQGEATKIGRRNAARSHSLPAAAGRRADRLRIAFAGDCHAAVPPRFNSSSCSSAAVDSVVTMFVATGAGCQRPRAALPEVVGRVAQEATGHVAQAHPRAQLRGCSSAERPPSCLAPEGIVLYAVRSQVLRIS